MTRRQTNATSFTITSHPHISTSTVPRCGSWEPMPAATGGCKQGRLDTEPLCLTPISLAHLCCLNKKIHVEHSITHAFPNAYLCWGCFTSPRCSILAFVWMQCAWVPQQLISFHEWHPRGAFHCQDWANPIRATQALMLHWPPVWGNRMFGLWRLSSYSLPISSRRTVSGKCMYVWKSD